MRFWNIADHVTPYRALDPAPRRRVRVIDLETGDYVLDREGRFTWKTQVADPAGHGPRRTPGLDVGHSWRLQLAQWGLRMDADPLSRRVWEVLVLERGRGKLSRSLPSGKFIRIFEDGRLIGRRRVQTGKQDGPLYELPYCDARALWRDRFIHIRPAIPFLGRCRPTEGVSDAA